MGCCVNMETSKRDPTTPSCHIVNIRCIRWSGSQPETLRFVLLFCTLAFSGISYSQRYMASYNDLEAHVVRNLTRGTRDSRVASPVALESRATGLATRPWTYWVIGYFACPSPAERLCCHMKPCSVSTCLKEMQKTVQFYLGSRLTKSHAPFCAGRTMRTTRVGTAYEKQAVILYYCMIHYYILYQIQYLSAVDSISILIQNQDS